MAQQAESCYTVRPVPGVFNATPDPPPNPTHCTTPLRYIGPSLEAVPHPMSAKGDPLMAGAETKGQAYHIIYATLYEGGS